MKSEFISDQFHPISFFKTRRKMLLRFCQYLSLRETSTWQHW